MDKILIFLALLGCVIMIASNRTDINILQKDVYTMQQTMSGTINWVGSVEDHDFRQHNSLYQDIND